MAGIEVAAIALGAAVVKSASKIWLGDRQFAADMSSELIDVLAGKVTSQFDQRRISRFFEDCTDIVAKRLVTLLDAEFRSVPGNERNAAVLAVRDTFARTALTDEALFHADLDARLVERQLRPKAAAVLRGALLSDGGEQVYWLVLRESCSYLVEVVTTLPKFVSGAITELLRRQTLVLATLSRVLDRLPERRGVEDFEADYSRVVANKLDRMELLGVTLADANRRYPLSVAYIDLSVMRREGRGGRLLAYGDADAAASGAQRAEGVLSQGSRALIMGAAGSGKTTLLQWLAVRSARGDFTGPLAALNDTIPFFIPLRRYVDRGLPAPEEFPLAVGAHIAHDMPPGWVHGLLRDGRALILVDGVDEMPEGQRDRVRGWLTDLAETFYSARFMVTSRPAAIEEGWLDKLGFTTTELQPMSTADVAEFVHQWHEAVSAELLDVTEKAELGAFERSLLGAIDGDRHLRALSVSPLLCALLCALNRERRTHLPADRIETYAAALDMLLDRRDRERGVMADGAVLSRGDKVLLLQDIAYWLVRNGWSDAPTERVVAQIARSVPYLRGVDADARDVFRLLLERSGLLREPSAHRVDFVHRTFQEYLAGKAAAENDEIGLLVKNAHDDQWREVVVMAAGHAQPEQCAELLEGLLRRGRRRGQRDTLWPLAVVSAHSARRIDPKLRAQIAEVTGQLVPPATDEVAEALAGTGEMLLTLLRAQPPRTHAQARASIRAASKIGGQGAMEVIGQILARHAGSVQVGAAVMNSWRFFNPGEYMSRVLVPSWPPDRELILAERAFLSVLHQFSELRSVRCELESFSIPAAGIDLSPLAANRMLGRVALIGCPATVDLSPLLRLPLLEDLKLEFEGRLPDITGLAGVPGLRRLSLGCADAVQSLRALAGFGALTWLELVGCRDVAGLDALEALPCSLQALRLYGFPSLSSLAGAERWEGLRTLELFECPLIADLGPVARVTSLERVTIGTFQVSTTDLAPLGGLPRLRELTLMGHGVFDLRGLGGKPDLVVRVPVNSRLTGVDKLGPGSTVAEFDVGQLP